MDIPDKAVEAAEKAVIDAMIKDGPDGHIDGYDVITRAALEAAAPYMLAEAWEQGAQAEEDCPPLSRRPSNPYRS